MNILVINSGSATIKFQLITTDATAISDNSDQTLVKGVIERIGSQSLIRIEAPGQKPIIEASPLRNHQQALDYLLKWLIASTNQMASIASISDIHAVGHRRR